MTQIEHFKKTTDHGLILQMMLRIIQIKLIENYDNLINILGADHTGYIKRITAAVSALSNKKVKLNCKVCQLVKLYKKDNHSKCQREQVILSLHKIY